MPTRRLITSAFVLVAILAAAPAMATVVEMLDITVRPVEETGTVRTIEVMAQLSPGYATPGFAMPLHVPGVRHLADSVRDVEMRDANGTLPFAESTDESSNQRRWTPNRRVTGPLSVTYRLTAQATSENGGPPFGMKPAGGGVAGSTMGLLMLPDDDTVRHTTLDVDLSGLPGGSVAASSAGAIPVVVDADSTSLRHIWILAGPARHYRSAGFESYVLGVPPPDAADFGPWAASAYHAINDAFTYLPDPPYRFLVRVLEGEAFATGTAEPGGALVTLGTQYVAGQDADYLHGLVFHEMTHQWVGQTREDDTWFSEGLTTYISTILPCKAGFARWESCAAQFSQNARFAYDSPAARWTVDRIRNTPFGNEMVRRVPYGRGMLYFAELDGALRKKSGGKRQLLDALRPLFTSRRGGQALTPAVFEEMLSREIGSDEVARFRSGVLDGSRVIVPDDVAFGGCMRRVVVHWVDGTMHQRAGHAWLSTGRCPVPSS